MTNPTTRKLSAKQILADIRSGMGPSALKSKYGLSDKALQSVYRQLSAAGALTENEVPPLQHSVSQSEASHEMPAEPGWRCPACNAPQEAEKSECPACGVVVTKFLARQEQGIHSSGVSQHFTRDADYGGKGWMSVISSIAFFLLVGGAILIWSTHRAEEKPDMAELGLRVQSSEEHRGEMDQPQENRGESESTSIDSGQIKEEESLSPIAATEPHAEVPLEPPAQEAPPPPKTRPPNPKPAEYVTGVLRHFASRDFKKEVVEASQTYPVLIQFYSDR